MKTFRALTLAVLVAVGSGSAASAAPGVVTSIKPVHSLVAAIMQGVATPHLIVKGGASPHSYALKPSDAAALERADVVFWIGPDLERFLETSLETLAPAAERVALENAAGLIRLRIREGGPFEAHEDEPAGEGHEDEGETETHVWLDPVNASAMALEIERALVTADPANAAAYRENTEALRSRLATLTEEIAAMLDPVGDRPFIVFHDAYQYFENRFGLTAAGSITVNPDVTPGARRLTDIQTRIKELGPVCVFAEPQFNPRLIETAIEGTDARSAVLDPVGADLADGPELYFTLLRNLAGSIKSCLSTTG